MTDVPDKKTTTKIYTRSRAPKKKRNAKGRKKKRRKLEGRERKRKRHINYAEHVAMGWSVRAHAKAGTATAAAAAAETSVSSDSDGTSQTA